jgi:hypothetical protein
MRLWKKSTKVLPKPFFCQKFYTTFTRVKSIQPVSATSVIYKKLHTVHNHPIGENSPNLVTLSAREAGSSNNTLLRNLQSHMYISWLVCARC